MVDDSAFLPVVFPDEFGLPLPWGHLTELWGVEKQPTLCSSVGSGNRSAAKTAGLPLIAFSNPCFWQKDLFISPPTSYTTRNGIFD